MLGIDPNFLCHHLALCAEAKPTRVREEWPEHETAKLREVGFIREVDYTTCLSNVVLMKKSNKKWKMFIDYTNLNKAYPKDSYPLPSIDRLVNKASNFQILNFFDTYSSYNQIRMYPLDEENIAFMIDGPNYCY
ncbi:hypothetical protein CR513_58198, partial [Mucuna pruriens]